MGGEGWGHSLQKVIFQWWFKKERLILGVLRQILGAVRNVIMNALV